MHPLPLLNLCIFLYSEKKTFLVLYLVLMEEFYLKNRTSHECRKCIYFRDKSDLGNYPILKSLRGLGSGAHIYPLMSCFYMLSGLEIIATTASGTDLKIIVKRAKLN